MSIYFSKILILLIFVLLLLVVPVSYAAIGNGWFDKNINFTSISDRLQRGSAWATCASVYYLMSGNQKEAGLRRDYRRLANATRFSVAVSQVIEKINVNMAKKEVDDLWLNSQKISNELTKAETLRILEEVERLSDEGISIEEIWEKFNRSAEICNLNSEEQLTHIPFIEELLSSARLSSKPLILEFITIDDQS